MQGELYLISLFEVWEIKYKSFDILWKYQKYLTALILYWLQAIGLYIYNLGKILISELGQICSEI